VRAVCVCVRVRALIVHGNRKAALITVINKNKNQKRRPAEVARGERNIKRNVNIPNNRCSCHGIPRLCPAIVSRDSARKPIGRVTAAVSSRPVIIHVVTVYYYTAPHISRC